MVYIKTYMFDHFYKQYLVLLTMAPRNSASYDNRSIYQVRISSAFDENLFSLLGEPKVKFVFFCVSAMFR